MSIRLGYQVHCDRSDCNRHAEFVCEPDELWEQMRHAGWTVDRRSRHFCGSHGTHAKKHDGRPLTRTVADDLPISRHTIPQIRCPACWLDIPNQTPVPYHADSTGITTCPASGQALTREKENA